MDTCCIDKSNNAKLSKAINSLFCWYQSSTRYYVHLSDISNTQQSEQLCKDESCTKLATAPESSSICLYIGICFSNVPLASLAS